MSLTILNSISSISKFKALSISSGVLAYILFNYLKYKKCMRRLESVRRAATYQNEIVLNDCVFFYASGANECKMHIYKKYMCYNVDCPYRKLRYLCDTLGESRKSLDICIHLLTCDEIAWSIISCHERGIRVRVLCDVEMSINKGSQMKKLFKHGIRIRMVHLDHHTHNKLAIIDGNKVVTGSVNWTIQGMYGNWDNLVVTGQMDIVRDAISAFNRLWDLPNTVEFRP